MFCVNCGCDSYLWGWACLRARSLWPAVWFHCFHNWFSQFLFPRLFSGESELWTGEHGLFATAAHLFVALLLAALLRRRGEGWWDLVARSRAV